MHDLIEALEMDEGILDWIRKKAAGAIGKAAADRNRDPAVKAARRRKRAKTREKMNTIKKMRPAKGASAKGSGRMCWGRPCGD